MAKRSSKQIQESLLEQYKVWRRGSGTDLPPLEGGGGGGLGSVTTSRIPRNIQGPAGKPHYKIDPVTKEPVLQNPKVWRRGESSASDARKRAEAFLSGQGFKTKSEPPSVDKPQVTPGSLTAQERLVQQAQLAQRGQDTAQPATVRDLIAAVPGLTKTNMAGAALGGGLIGAGLGLKGVEMLSDPVSAEQERAEWLKKFDAGLEKSGQEQQQIGQSIEQSQKVLDRLGPRQRRAKKDQKNEAAEKPTYTREQYLGWAKKYAEQFDVPLPMVLHAMFKETGWLRNAERMRTAESPKGALGVMQILPKYAEKGAYKIKVEDLLDPEKNIEAGVRGLSYFLNKHKTVEKALAAYNAGEAGAARFLKTGDVRTLPTEETRKYVAAYKDDVIHQLEKFFPKDKKKVEQVAANLLDTATTTQPAQAVDQAPVATTSADKKAPSAEKTNVGTKTQTAKPVGSTYTTTDTQGKTTTYTKNAKGQWVSKSGEIMPMPVAPAQDTTQPKSAEKTQPSKDSEPSWFEKLFGIPQARENIRAQQAEITKREQERERKAQTKQQPSQSDTAPKPATVTAQSVDTGTPKSPAYQPLFTLEKEKREREQARKSNKPMQAPSFDPELDPKGWAEYEEYMQQRQIDAGDRFSREREARLAGEKKAAEKSAQRDVSSLLQKDQAGIKSAYRGSAGAQAIMQQNPDVIKDINRIRAGSTIKIDGQDYTIKPGDTLDQIAKKMKPSVQAVSPEPASVQGSAQDYDDFRKLIDVAAGMPRVPAADDEVKPDSATRGSNSIINKDITTEPADVPVTDKVGERAAAKANLMKELGITDTPSTDDPEEDGIDKFLKDIGYIDRLPASSPETDSDEPADKQTVKETINTQSHAELHDILRLAGRMK